MYNLNREKAMIMHIDLNSAFATTEQQAHPTYRGKPVGVTNRLSKECVVIAASYEAKDLGIKVGTRRSEAIAICPEFVFFESDPAKYHAVYLKLVAIMRDYSSTVKMLSVDEGLIDFHNMEAVLNGRTLEEVGYEIKQRVRDEIGEWMRINIGIGTNRFLAKEAAGWHKPDGLDSINHTNLTEYYKQRKLTDLSGIAERYEARLNSYGIMTPMDFLKADEFKLKKQVFKSITGLYWHKRLRGYEIDDYETKVGIVGRQWVVHKPSADDDYLLPCLSSLCETVGKKLRFRQKEARGIFVWVRYMNGESWQAKRMRKMSFYTNQEVYQYALELFKGRHAGTVIMMGISCYQLVPSQRSQLGLFEDVEKKDRLTEAFDSINDQYGLFTIYSATTLHGQKIVKQKIPFGSTDYFELLLKRS